MRGTMATKQSILMLGGSRQQVVAIETARRLGYRTVLCDYLADNPGQYAADVFYQESTTDREAMLAVARKERVAGVLAYASDPAAITAAYVAESMGLPTNPLCSVETLSEKHLFRAHLKHAGLPCPVALQVAVGESPESVIARSREVRMRYPVVLKPTDSSGSKGVTIIERPDTTRFEAALAHAAGFSRNQVLVLEEYIEAGFPRVIGGDIFVVDGEVRFWGLMSCFRNEALGGLVPIGERNPSGLSKGQEHAVKQVLQQLVSSLGLRFGELNLEVIMGKDDKPYVIELGARAGGNMIPVQLSDISGIDLVEANVRYAMGDEGLDVRFEGSDAPYATYVLHAERDGVFDGVDIAPIMEQHIYRRVMYSNPGDAAESFDGANKALGIFFMRFDTTEQMEDLMANVTQNIRARVR